MDYIAGLALFEKNEKLCKRIHFLVIEWQRVYPDVNLKYEFASAHQWLVMNCSKKKDYSKYLWNWVRRTQEKINTFRALNKQHPNIQMPTRKYVESKPQDEVMEAGDWAKLKDQLVKAKIAARRAL